VSTRLEEYGAAPEFEGVIVYDPDWYLLEVPPEFHAGLVKLLEGVSEPYKVSARPHVSVMKDEAPCRNKEEWGTKFVGERVTLKCSPTLRGENGMHFWVDCYAPRLCQMREHFGLTTLKRDGVYLVNFHLTVARRKKPVPARLRAQLRLSPQSHIDVETGMQHL
jgi:hypothetical protein